MSMVKGMSPSHGHAFLKNLWIIFPQTVSQNKSCQVFTYSNKESKYYTMVIERLLRARLVARGSIVVHSKWLCVRKAVRTEETSSQQ